MNKLLRNVLILFFPILLMIGVNEFSNIPSDSPKYKSRGIETINPGTRIVDRCTWVCHNDTGYCKTHHVKFNAKYFTITDRLYFGMIGSLQSFGNYRLANAFLLVLFFPLLIYVLVIKSLNIRDKIIELRKA